jgi:hypothetical protein
MKERLKNVGVEPSTHKALKMLCAENDWTMTQAIEHLMERLKNDGNAGADGVDRAGKKPSSKPRKAD